MLGFSFTDEATALSIAAKSTGANKRVDKQFFSTQNGIASSGQVNNSFLNHSIEYGSQKKDIS